MVNCIVVPPNSENSEPTFHFSQYMDCDGDIVTRVSDGKGCEVDLFYLSKKDGFELNRFDISFTEFFDKYGGYFSDLYLDKYLPVNLRPDE